MTAPLVWLLVGPKAGDNAQLRAVAAALAARTAVRVEERALAFHGAELLVTLSRRPSRAGLRRGSDRLAPPWPDLVLTAGRRNEPVARWIRARSGGRTRIVHFGRPWSRPDEYDLTITTPQYLLDREAGAILELPLPPVAARSLVEPPVPALTVLIGGDSGATVLDAAGARATLRGAAAIASSRGWHLRVTTSARTPAPARAALEALADENPDDVGIELHRYGADGENPYGRWLADSSAFVVTVDSVSMITEAVATGRPVWLAPLPAPTRPWWLTRRGWRWKPLTHELAQRLAPRRFRRDVGRLIEVLVAQRRAAWLDEGAGAHFAAATSAGDSGDGAAQAAERIATLLER